MKLYVFQCKKITNFTLSMKNKQENAVKDFFFFFFFIEEILNGKLNFLCSVIKTSLFLLQCLQKDFEVYEKCQNFGFSRRLG